MSKWPGSLLVSGLMLLSPASPVGEKAAAISVLTWLLQDGVISTSRWGATPPPQQARPETGWLSRFEGITPIDVPSVGLVNIEDALSRCIPDAYCVIRLDQLLLRDTVYLGRSKTKLLGKPGNQIRYTDTQGGTGAFFELVDDVQEVLIEGLNLDGESTPYNNKNVFGIVVYGQRQNKIAVLNNRIFGLNSDADAHAIAVYGTGAGDADQISNVLIDGNQINDMRTGSSETIAVNGNVSRWQISNNTIERVNNIAIGLIGGEGTSPADNRSGRVLPGEFDAARNGFVEYNIVNDMTTLDNPAYASAHSWAGAIYVDGAHSLQINNNSVSNSEWAYDIGAENCVTAHDILLENNTASGSYYGDLILGGYAEGGYRLNNTIVCDPLNTIDENEGHGYVENITVRGNLLNTLAPIDDQGSPNVQYRIRQSIVTQPPLVAEHPDGVVIGDQNSIRTAP